jgi:hypothetical protein
VAIVTVLHVAVAGAQPQVVVVDRGPGASGQLLAEVLARPYRLIEPDTAQFILARDERVATNLVVLGRRSTSIDGRVDGDLVVVGGDLFVHPGAAIGGRAIAIGGAVYSSTLADSLNETFSFRDNTFIITRSASGYELRYQSLYADATGPLTLPGIYGLRPPSYDRVNGASVSAGPALSFAGGRGIANALVTYRSDLGKVDPSADVALQIDRRLRVEAYVGRGTHSNDRWIWSDYVNSLSALVLGTDTRNYYRADRAEATLHRLWETSTLTLEPFLGARAERSWAVGPWLGEAGSPWSIFGRTDTLDGMRRPNPPVPELDMVSALGGADLHWESGGVTARGRALAERSLHLDGPAPGSNGHFLQLTLDLYVAFLTFRDQQYEVDVHHVTTPEGSPPPQRFGYIGGSGTLPFLDLLGQGGGELLFVDQRYSIPVPRIQLGALGVPTLLLRHRLGSAGPSRLPALEQVLGVGVIISILRGEFLIDPATRDTRLSVGLSFAR